jgi:hypothetical protein
MNTRAECRRPPDLEVDRHLGSRISHPVSHADREPGGDFTMIARANGQARGARRGPYDTRSPSARIKALRCRRRGHDQAGTQSLRSNWGRRPIPKAKNARRIGYGISPTRGRPAMNGCWSQKVLTHARPRRPGCSMRRWCAARWTSSRASWPN